MIATREQIDDVLRGLRVFDADLSRRNNLAGDLVSEGMTVAQVYALLKTCQGKASPGAVAWAILQGDWKAELARKAEETAAREEGRSAKEEELATLDRERETQELQDRAKANAMTVPEFLESRRRGAAWELLAYSHLSPEQIAAQTGASVAQVLADLHKAAEERGTTLEAATDIHGRAERLARMEESFRQKRKAAKREKAEEQPYILPPGVLETRHLSEANHPRPTPPTPTMPVLTEAEAARAHEAAKAFMAKHLAKADRAWVEQFGDQLKHIDPELHARMASGPKPEPWIYQAMSRGHAKAKRSTRLRLLDDPLRRQERIRRGLDRNDRRNP